MLTQHIPFDRASYRNRGGFIQKLVSFYKAKKHITKFGCNLVIKFTAVFRLTDNSILEMGDNCTIQEFSFFQLTKPSPKVYIGNNVVIGRNTIITAKNLISIGDDVLVGSFVQIIDHNHGKSSATIIRAQPAVIGEVIIESDVWIGAGAKILMNSHIGKGAIIGANAVVSGNIPSNAIAVGVPARVVGQRM